jgi:hypothetical protein
MYHTQEKRLFRLIEPAICKRNNAWLGTAYYFWNDEVDAIQWGHNSKKATGYFEVYSAIILCNRILDTVFNEDNYRFWIEQIEKAAKHITMKTGLKATLKDINQYFQEKARWSDYVDGILFQDLPNSEDLLVSNFYYRKRIQMAIYNKEIIHNFEFHNEWKCN